MSNVYTSDLESVNADASRDLEAGKDADLWERTSADGIADGDREFMIET